MTSFQLFSPSPFLCALGFLILVLVNIQSSLSTPEMIEECARPFRCGHITAGYPFWGDEPNGGLDICGHRNPNFRLNCENNETTLVIDKVEYLVFKITETTAVLNISRKDYYYGGICPSNISNFPNTTIPKPFEILPGYKMLTLHYGFLKVEEELTCSSADINDNHEFSITFGGLGLPHYVSVNVMIPAEISVRALKENLSVLGEALKQGFEVKWNVKDWGVCEKCLQSGGRCGYALGWDRPICYCSNRPFDPLQESCSISPAGQPPGDPPSTAGKYLKLLGQC